MKYLLLLMMLTTVSCRGQYISSHSQSYKYEDFAHLHMEWIDIFNMSDDQYFVYVYSKNCGYCQSIKQEIFCYVSQPREIPFYFISVTNDVERGQNIELTLNASTIDEIFIIGVPTLLVIDNKILIIHIAGRNSVINFLSNYR